jgi:phosphate transport system substrate-binding protein
MRQLKGLLAAVTLLMGMAAPAFAATLINGAGATFPYPIYSKWFDLYHRAHPELQFNYQSIGSGGGIRQFLAQTVDFGASDSPMTDDQIKSAPGKALHIPTVLGAVVIPYNLPELKVPMKLTGSVLADIFLGVIKKWNDPKISALHPGVMLPAKDILVAHRSDGSGTTFVFSDYLSKVSPAWLQKVGRGNALNWPVGLGGKGNEGVTGLVKQTPGSIGYVEMAYAVQNKLPMAQVQNKAGEFMAPTTAAVTAAAAGVSIPDDFRVSMTDPAGKGAYPISSFTYLLVYDSNKDAVKGRAIADFLKWAMTMGQTFAAPLHYAPLPATVVQRVQERIAQMK